jgi:hypothetical protein
MKTFECDFDLKSNNKDISKIGVSEFDSRISISISVENNIEAVSLEPSKARELAAELIRLADEIEKQ